MTNLAQQIKALAGKAEEEPSLGYLWKQIEAKVELADFVAGHVDQILTALSEAERMREALEMIEAGHPCPSAIARAAIGGE